MADWFTLFGKELQTPIILAENLYNMDELGVLLSPLNSLEVLVSQDALRNDLGAGVKRTLITAIECPSADDKHLPPLVNLARGGTSKQLDNTPYPKIIFSHALALDIQSLRSVYTGIQKVFDPLTKRRPGLRPRILVCDGFGTHESLEVIKHGFENNVILCRIPSHTSLIL